MWNPYQRVTNSGIIGAGAVLTVLALWSIISGFDIIETAKLPAPWEVLHAFVQLSWDSNRGESPLLIATLWSAGRIFVSALLVIAIGVPIGISMGASPYINAFLSPLIDPFRSAPVAALLPVLVMMFGIGETMKVVFLFLGAVVYLIPMVRDAVRDVPQNYWVSARDLGATNFEAVHKAVVPLARPRIADATVAAISVQWTYLTIAEYVNASRGLGQLIQNARRFSAMDQVFAGIFVIIALALVTYQGMLWAKDKLYPWAKGA